MAGGCALSEEDSESQTTSSSLASAMECKFAATPYTPGQCWHVGRRASTASFKLVPGKPACGYVWYDHPECTTNICSVPITPDTTITLGAYYIACDNGSPTLGAAATATYDREDACPLC